MTNEFQLGQCTSNYAKLTYSTRFYGLKPVPAVIEYVEPVKCNVYSVLLIEACTIGGMKFHPQLQF